jgi:hypothetical protein
MSAAEFIQRLYGNLPERVAAHGERIYRKYECRQHEFPKFVLDHYVQRGVTELDPASSITENSYVRSKGLCTAIGLLGLIWVAPKPKLF